MSGGVRASSVVMEFVQGVAGSGASWREIEAYSRRVLAQRRRSRGSPIFATSVRPEWPPLRKRFFCYSRNISEVSPIFL